MQAGQKGQSKIVARARLMLLLGEQLITDENAAISELVKNSYDADATKVVVTLCNVSEPESGYIMVRDNGHGMTHEKVLSSWLELGTPSKARESNLRPRFSETKHRVYLGEKGLGRLAVHKLGNLTELVTRRLGTNLETKLTLDWTAFEKSEGFLEEIPIEWETTEPSVFTDSIFKNGTQIVIRKLRRRWSGEMIRRVQSSLFAMKSPFSSISDFEINIEIKDKEAPEISPPDMTELINRATYSFTGKIDNDGQITYRYKFERPDFGELDRKIEKTKDICDSEHFANERKPTCGSFSLRLYAWDLSPQDIKAVFGDTAIYREMIKPNTGVKVFRDEFRVLPYGNTDNDWLSMDIERVRRFELRLSRNQVIGAIEVSSETNPRLLDKTDREGLIDNDEFRDFRSLVKSAIAEFEAERYRDRRHLKQVTGRTRDEMMDRTVFTKNMAFLSNTIMNQPQIDAETKLQVTKAMSEAHEALNSILAEREQPLLVAASIGLTYMMPTHEVRRELHEAMKILRKMRDSKEMGFDQANSVITLLKQADSTVGGIGRLMQRTTEDEVFELEKSAREAFELMQFRLKRNDIAYKLDVRNSRKVSGSDRLITILLLNFLDNSIYWLLRKKPEERKIKVIIDSYDDGSLLMVSDSGLGFGDDDINTVTLPFFTRKPNGMGLGLYIGDRIAKMHGGRLKLFSPNDLPDLLPGGNIAIIFPKTR